MSRPKNVAIQYKHICIKLFNVVLGIILLCNVTIISNLSPKFVLPSEHRTKFYIRKINNNNKTRNLYFAV